MGWRNGGRWSEEEWGGFGDGVFSISGTGVFRSVTVESRIPDMLEID